jgi:hypothetical protein
LGVGLTDKKFFWDDFTEIEAGDSCLFRVTAYSPDRTLSGQAGSLHPSIYEPDTVSTFNPGISSSPAAFSLYPVPAKDFLMIKRDNPGPFIYQIYDTAGKMAASGEEKGSGTQREVSLDMLKPGVYMMVITTEGKNPERLQFIKL